MTVTDIIVKYLLVVSMSSNNIFASHELENEMPKFGQLNFNKLANPSTYARKFRLLKSSERLSKENIMLTLIKKNSSEFSYRVDYGIS